MTGLDVQGSSMSHERVAPGTKGVTPAHPWRVVADKHRHVRHHPSGSGRPGGELPSDGAAIQSMTIQRSGG